MNTLDPVNNVGATLAPAMPVIGRTNIDNKQVHEDEPHKFTAFASDFECFPPGKLPPQQISTDLGNGQPFILTYVSAAQFMYKQSLGCISLTVYND